MCEGHHSKHWLRDHGDTDARSGVLLCWHHHDYVHDNGIEITWKPGGGWQFTDRHGTTLHRRTDASPQFWLNRIVSSTARTGGPGE